ncbi:MAG: Zn-dependent oligopeptidase [Candidatus Eremiobacteraeota bacterium]|nr:Zn-dependent oligopeptidase [Candidatus Eremiobacteraeota bacterium]
MTVLTARLLTLATIVALAAPSAAAWAQSPTPAGSGTLAPPAASAPGIPSAVDYTLDPAQIKTNCAAQIAAVRKAIEPVARASRGTFATVVLPLENLSADANDKQLAETLLSQVSSDRKIRDASLACQNDINNVFTEITARPDLYRAVAAASASNTAQTEADRKLTSLWLVALKRSGAGLGTSDRKTFVKLSQRLNELQNQYQANLGNDATTITISQAQLAGLPPDLVATLKKSGASYIVPVNESTETRFLQNAKDAKARRTMYFAAANKAYPKNTRLLEEAIGIRDRLAHLMGYPTWAAFQLADRMAGSPARVESFLSDLDVKLFPRAKSDLATLAALKGSAIEPWDTVFYDNQLNKTKYAVDSTAVARYFPVDHVVRAVFDIYAKILGVTYAERTPANAWAPDVTEWAVSDAKTGRYLGDFYLDLFPRPGKYSHFASFPLLPNRRMSDGTVRPPQDAIIGNWPQPAPGKPALLSHDDVQTFFHEFGHDMATILSTAPYETLSGGFRQDFVEAPSQMLENWVWDPQILKQLSANVDTGAPLPDALIAKMRAARYVDNAYFTTRQIMLAQIDMRYHTSGPTVNTDAVWRAVSRETSPLATPLGAHPEAQFGHLMGGYDVGYYGYLWSKVYAQDMFTAFEAGGLESPVVGARYRKDILEPARQREPDAEVTAFLGRPMSPVAFYKEFGVAVKAPNAK